MGLGPESDEWSKRRGHTGWLLMALVSTHTYTDTTPPDRFGPCRLHRPTSDSSSGVVLVCYFALRILHTRRHHGMCVLVPVHARRLLSRNP